MGLVAKSELSGSSGADRATLAAIAGLTPTQVKVLQGVHSGLLNKQIAFGLGITEATVKGHLSALMRRLRVRNRTQVAVLAQATTLLEPGE
jgi:DNA-binding NarL/FixJ family response regulator